MISQYIDRIKRYNLDTASTAPLNAIVSINLSIIDQARHLDAEFRKHKSVKGRLFCIPVLLKDNIDSFDTPSSSGSLSLMGLEPEKDTVIITRMRNEGALILGKTTMDEFASGLWGKSSRSGKTGNAYDPRRNSGGSSAGSAVAISANFSVLSIGTDNSGSLRIPAAYNGVYTIRSTLGLISQGGIFPRGNLDGVAGPMARTMMDLVIAMDIIAGAPNHSPPYSSYLKKDGLTGKRIGVLRSVNGKDIFQGRNPEVNDIFARTIRKLQALSAILVDGIEISKYNLDRKDNLSGEVEEINTYLASLPALRLNYEDICRSGLRSDFKGPKECLTFLSTIASKESSAYKKVIEKFSSNKQIIESTMDRQKLDALLLPIDTQGFPDEVGTSDGLQTHVGSNAGLPGIVLLAGYSSGAISMPVGMELLGRSLNEGLLIEMGYAFEQAGQHRIPPHVFENQPGSNKLLGLSLVQLNHLFTRIGWKTFNQVLRTGKREDLNPDLFRNIVKDIIQ